MILSIIEGSSGGLMYRNMQCGCGHRALVKISESANNLRKLYCHCPSSNNKKCGFFKWLTPEKVETRLTSETIERRTNQDVKTRLNIDEMSSRLKHLQANEAATMFKL
ncbi:unnamed protein product [Ilex paraguariensis]|uniref:GRF-type domain-containing protein n=1 Tax=Ilex paraguariensis TaxID=185542 RepID=A0ABC8UWG8_9AQUA